MANDAFDWTLSYTYNYDYLPPLAMSDGLHLRNLPSLRWLGLVIEAGVKIIVNAITAKIDKDSDESRTEELRKAQKKAEAMMGQFRSISSWAHFHETAQAIFGEFKDLAKNAVSLQDYHELFATIDLPPSAACFSDDAYFASVRVAGFNPLTLRRVQSLPPKFPLTQTKFAQAPGFEHDFLDKALMEGRLYLVDFEDLHLEPGQNPAPKQVYRPMGLFGIPAAGGPLAVIALQGGQDPVTYPLFGPQDGTDWQKAKTVFDIADTNYHELINHLGRTHLMMEPFLVATHTQLRKNHPVRKLLVPSLEGTDFINAAALAYLVNPGGLVDQLLMGTLESDLKLAARAVQEPGFNRLMLPNRFEEQGLMDPRLLYPYRDDALLIWKTIHDWVSDYLHLFYKDDASVQNDAALQAWAADLISPKGGRLQGFGINGGIPTLAYLTDALTMVMFTAGPQHAAMNFPQFAHMSFTPASPLAGYQPAPTASGSDGPWLNLLPSLEMAQLQLSILYLIGTVYHTRLGAYDDDAFDDRRIQPLLASFQAHLVAAEEEIQRRNKIRPIKYTYLLPSKTPMSINI